MARTDYGAILSTKIADTSQAIRDVNKTVGTIAPADWGTLIRGMKSGADYQNALDQMVEESATGSIASFTDGANNIPAKEVICHINPTETGTGEKSPSNPYIIGGHSEINVYQRATNLWDEQWEVGGYATSNGQPVALNDRIRSKNFIAITPSTSFRFKTPEQVTVLYYDKSLNYVGYAYVQSNREFTTSSRGYFLKFATSASYGTTYNHDISINYPSTDTEYHAYTADTYTVPFGQTVYGGELVLHEGQNDKIIPKLRKITLDGTQNIQIVNWRPQTNSVGWLYPNDLIDNKKPASGGVKVAGTSNKLVMDTFNNVYSGDNDMFSFYHYNQYSIVVRVRDTSLTSREAINAYLARNPIDIYYPLATPEEITLQTKTVIPTLLGANNFYHDCNGDTDVIYRANGALYVEQHS